MASFVEVSIDFGEDRQSAPEGSSMCKPQCGWQKDASSAPIKEDLWALQGFY